MSKFPGGMAKHPRRAEGEKYLLQGKSIRWIAKTVQASPNAVSKWRDELVKSGKMAAPVPRERALPAKKSVPEQIKELSVDERIDARIAQSEIGGPEWSARRMRATLEETFHTAMRMLQHEAGRLEESENVMSQRDRTAAMVAISTEIRRMMTLAAGLMVEADEDKTSVSS